MKNVFFPEEDVSENDLYFVCSMIERIARQIKQHNKYVVNTMGHVALAEKLSLANVLHCENPLAVAHDWIEDYKLKLGDFDITDVDTELCRIIPTALQMGKVYKRLIISTLTRDEDYADGILRVYNDDICTTIDNYNSSAYYEPSYYLTRCYFAGTFN